MSYIKLIGKVIIIITKRKTIVPVEVLYFGEFEYK